VPLAELEEIRERQGDVERRRRVADGAVELERELRSGRVCIAQHQAPAWRAEGGVERSQIVRGWRLTGRQGLGGRPGVVAQYQQRWQARVQVGSGQPAFGEPHRQVGLSADQLDGQALVPVQGVDEVDEQRLAAASACVSVTV